MKDKEKTKEQLLCKLEALRRELNELKSKGKGKKQSQEGLGESEEQLKGILSSLHETVIVILDREGKHVSVWAPPELDKRYGLSGDELVGKRLTDLFPDQGSKEKIAGIQRIFETGEPLRMEYLAHLPGGNFWHDISFSPLRDSKGEVSAVVGFIRDITEQKKAEEALKESEEKFRDLSENANDLIQSVDASGKFVYVNKKWLETLGYSKEELGKLKLTDILREDQIPHYMEIIKKVCSGESFEKVETIFISKDGSEIVVEGNVNAKIRDGRFIATRGIFRDITKQKKTEEAYHALVENSLQGLGIAQDNKVAFVNPAIAEMLGYSIKELMSLSPKEWKALIHPEDLALVWERFLSRFKGKKVPPRYELRMIRKDGKVIWVELFSSQIEYGGRPAIQAAFVDITERKRAEEKLKEVEQEKATILNSMAEHVVYYDKEMSILWANKAAAESAGLPADEMAGRHCYEVWRQKSEPCINCPVIDAIETGEPHQTELTNKDGRIWFVKAHPVRNTNGGIVGAVEITLDITQRKKVEEVLKQSERDYRGLFESAHDAILILDPEGEIVLDVNQRACTIYGFDRSEFIGMSLKSISKDVTQGRKHMKVALEEGFYHHFETCQYRKDGTEILLEINASVVEYKGKRSILSINRDITERKKMQEELLKAKKLESIGILAGGIAHDFNNILTGILGNISLAKAKTDAKDELQKILIKAEKASLRAKDLTQQLLTFSKGGAPIRKTTSIAELLEDSISFALRGSKTRCEFSIAEDLWQCHIDVGQISQVINNLIINADQAMPGGGLIKVDAENVKVGAKEGLSLDEGKFVKITIQDQGIGIPKEHLQKIFDPYFTTKHKGNGLGLATSYSIVKNHNGCIVAESELGVGSIFSVYFSASRSKVRKKKPIEQTPLAGEGKILVMDDEEVVREVVGDLLAILGYQVEFAKDGAQMIELYKMAKESAQPFDAVIMDLTVPGGMGGKESIQKLLKIDPEIKAIVSSGYSNDPVMSDFRKYGFSGVVAKPFKIEDLGALLHKVLMGMSKSPA